MFAVRPFSFVPEGRLDRLDALSALLAVDPAMTEPTALGTASTPEAMSLEEFDREAEAYNRSVLGWEFDQAQLFDARKCPGCLRLRPDTGGAFCSEWCRLRYEGKL